MVSFTDAAFRASLFTDYRAPVGCGGSALEGTQPMGTMDRRGVVPSGWLRTRDSALM